MRLAYLQLFQEWLQELVEVDRLTGALKWERVVFVESFSKGYQNEIGRWKRR